MLYSFILSVPMSSAYHARLVSVSKYGFAGDVFFIDTRSNNLSLTFYKIVSLTLYELVRSDGNRTDDCVFKNLMLSRIIIF
jgi:hypothetical protein